MSDNKALTQILGFHAGLEIDQYFLVRCDFLGIFSKISSAPVSVILDTCFENGNLSTKLFQSKNEEL